MHAQGSLQSQNDPPPKSQSARWSCSSRSLSGCAGTYNAAILENRADFEGKTVMDVGAGSGILSLFAVQVCEVDAVMCKALAVWRRTLDTHCCTICRCCMRMQAGAAKIYAVEASNMAHYAQKIFNQNPGLGLPAACSLQLSCWLAAFLPGCTLNLGLIVLSK